MSPRIAYLLKKFPRLSETFILNELLGLQDHDVELHVFSRRAPDDEPRHPELGRLSASVEVLPHPRTIDPWTLLFGGADGPWDALLARLPDLVRALDGFDLPRLPELVGEAVYLRRRCAELGIDHVHVHFGTDAAVVAWILSELGGPGYSITLHAKDIYRSSVDAGRLERVVAGSAFSVTVCDANVRHLATMLGDAGRARVRRLYNGIDLTVHGVWDGARDEAHVLSVGRLVEKKGFDVLLAALAHLRDAGRTLRATFVGDGEERDALVALRDSLGLSASVTFAGPLPQDEVRRLLGTATLFALPCRVGTDGNRDALPTVLLEALAWGLPVVSTPVTGIPEIVGEGRAGLLVPEDDPRSLAVAMARLLDEPALRDELAEAGRRRAVEHFDVMRNTAVLSSWLAEAAHRAGTRC